MFHEKFVNYTDSATQHPHALGQVFIAEMLGSNGWQIDGFILWMRSLCGDYQRRRDLLLEVLLREVGSSGYATARTPQAGMFVWIEIHLERHPRYSATETPSPDQLGRTNVPALMQELFDRLLAADVVVMPASLFAIEEDLEFVDRRNHIPINDVRSSKVILTQLSFLTI